MQLVTKINWESQQTLITVIHNHSYKTFRMFNVEHFNTEI